MIKFTTRDFTVFNFFRYYAYPPEEIVQLDLVNPMCEAFPRVASCTFWKYGTGGKPVGHNAICILALNMVIDKIYLVLWYWYLIVAILGTIRIICRLFQMSSGNIRYWLMKIKMHRYVIFYIPIYVIGNVQLLFLCYVCYLA